MYVYISKKVTTYELEVLREYINSIEYTNLTNWSEHSFPQFSILSPDTDFKVLASAFFTVVRAPEVGISSFDCRIS